MVSNEHEAVRRRRAGVVEVVLFAVRRHTEHQPANGDVALARRRHELGVVVQDLVEHQHALHQVVLEHLQQAIGVTPVALQQRDDVVLLHGIVERQAGSVVASPLRDESRREARALVGAEALALAGSHSHAPAPRDRP